MEGVGLAHLYPALAWSVCAPGPHGYPRAPDLILRKALRGRLGHQITGATARPFLHFLHPTRRPRQVSVASGTSVGHPLGGFEHVDPMRLLARRALRSCHPVPTQSKRSAPAYWRGRVPSRVRDPLSGGAAKREGPMTNIRSPLEKNSAQGDGGRM